MKRASYRHAIQWLADNDDCDWLAGNVGDSPSVSASLVADLFGIDIARVTTDLRREIARSPDPAGRALGSGSTMLAVGLMLLEMK